MAKKSVKLEFNAGSVDVGGRFKIIDKIFTNMHQKQNDLGSVSVLLHGDPGTGKTSLVKQLAKMLGFELVLIEAPHIVEEHLINIPFIVFGTDDSERKGNTEVDAKTYDVILSKSNLASILSTTKKSSDAELLKHIKTADTFTKKLWEEFGGSDTKIPNEIAEVRKTFNTILFLDEYFRQTSTNIRNVLRTILNGNIGNDKIPSGSFVLYASNMDDEGIDALPKNHQFSMVKVDNPTKDEWFSWLTSEFSEAKHKDVKLDKRIIDTFYTILKDEDISFNDFDSEIRTSPRRWAQVILYINASLPVEDEKDAKSLMTNIHHNFQNYKTKKSSSLLDKVSEAVAELIKETSDISIGKNSVNKESDWRETLKHQIKVKKKLGKHRSYIPVASGEPGTGKTSHAFAMAEEMNLGFISVDASVLSADDIVGIPLPKKSGGEHGTTFAEPALYKKIMSLADSAEKDRIDTIEHDVKSEKISKEEGKALLKDFKNSETKFLLFIDEINRVSNVKVFNSLRKVLLEKEVGEKKLDERFIIVAAMNPHDLGTLDLTSHMSDVMDTVQVSPSWEHTKAFINKIKFKDVDDVIPKSIQTVLETFLKKFSKESNEPEDKKVFYLGVGAEHAYISPRDISNLYTKLVVQTNKDFKRLFKDVDVEDIDTIKKKSGQLADSISESFEETLLSIFKSHDIDAPEFFHDLRSWFNNSEEADLTKILTTRKVESGISFEEIVKPYWEGDSKGHLSEEIEFINYLESAEVHTFVNDITSFILKEIDSEEALFEKGIKKSHKKKTLKDEKIEFSKEEVTKFEHFIRELIHSIKIHKMSGDYIEQIKDAIDKTLDEISNHADQYFSEFIDEVGSLRQVLKNEN